MLTTQLGINLTSNVDLLFNCFAFLTITLNFAPSMTTGILSTLRIIQWKIVMYPYCDKTKNMINLIGSGDAAYVPKAITCAIKTLDKIAANEALDEETRKEAAFAAANLVLSDYNDNN